ncbi:S-adenosyl-L-methionine-dependent methyltransferase [Stipitochalara longipes BDJ]|nr:S-adenosyl-L-methionine-dependent methyltransferase [Stipitochalara longipes BDJ]
MVSTTKALDVFNHLIGPWHLLLISASYLPGTIWYLIASLQLRTLFAPRRLQSAWFARFWSRVGSNIRERATPRIKSLIGQAHGVVLDIGPGNGEWLACFDKEKVEMIYGVEPNLESHGLLKEKIIALGLEDVYTIVPVGVEELGEWVKKEGKGVLGQGDVDSVVTVFCLCSVPQPKRMIGDLYGYLKEGGNWIVYEHVLTKQKGSVAWYQAYVDLFWPHFIGGCSITRDTARWLKEAGSWSKVDLKQPDDEPTYQILPHVMGVLTK